VTLYRAVLEDEFAEWAWETAIGVGVCIVLATAYAIGAPLVFDMAWTGWELLAIMNAVSVGGYTLVGVLQNVHDVRVNRGD